MEDATSRDDDAPFDPTRRKLCPDGSCVGVLGDDGICRVCGRTEAQAAAGEEAPSALDAPGAPGALDPSSAPEGVAGAFDSRRRLCDDGSCVGVVGDDGACRVCGRRAQ